MDVKIKDLFNVNFWFWLIVSIICVVLMVLAPGKAETFAAIIMALLMLFPCRDWFYRLLVWAIDYVSSVNTNIKDKINPHATYNRLIDPSKRFQNDGFYRILRTVISVITLVFALLWMVFQGAAFNTVYSCLHTIEFLFTGKIGWVRLLFYVLLTIVFIRFVIWVAGIILNGDLYSSFEDIDGEIHFYFDFNKAWWRILLMVLGFYSKIILSAILLKFTVSMAISSILFWTIVIGTPVLSVIIGGFIRRKFQTT